MSNRAHLTRLFCSPSLSWFHRRGRLYVYHDRVGDLLEMSPDLRELILFFEPGHTRDEAMDAFAHRLSKRDIDTFIDTLLEHLCLLPHGQTERAKLVEAYPLHGPWIVTYLNNEDRLEAVIGRNPETPPKRWVMSEWETQLWQLIDGQRSISRLATLLDETFPEQGLDHTLDATLDAIETLDTQRRPADTRQQGRDVVLPTRHSPQTRVP